MVDRLLVKPGIEHRLELSVGLAMKLAGGLVQVAVVGGEEQLYSEKLACPDCGINVPQLEPRSFSFNSAYGACPECHGLGSRYDFDPGESDHRLVEAAARRRAGAGFGFAEFDSQVQIAAAAHGIRPEHAVREVSGEDPEPVALRRSRQERAKRDFVGILAYLKRDLDDSTSDGYRDFLLDYMSATECPACHGQRLRPESLAVKVNGMSIADFTALPVSRALEAARKIKLDGTRSADCRPHRA